MVDPDFAEPLDGRLTLERGFRYTLELDCEDESLNVCRVVGSVRCEPRDGVNGSGCALLEVDLQQKSADEIRTLVFAEEHTRNAFLALLEHLQTDHRSFRRRGASLLAWLPTGCVAGCLPGCMARAPAVPHDASDQSVKPTLRSEPSRRHEPNVHLEDFKTYARQLWDRQSQAGSIRRLPNQAPIGPILHSRQERELGRPLHSTSAVRP